MHQPLVFYRPASKTRAVNSKSGEAAELLHENFLTRLLGVRKSTMNQFVLAKLGRFPLQSHFWQQILRFHHRALALRESRLVTLAFLKGVTLAPNDKFVFRDDNLGSSRIVVKSTPKDLVFPFSFWLQAYRNATRIA